MRKAIFIICGIQATICLVYLIAAFTISSDAAGEGMARGFALIGSIAVAIFIIPAVLLAWSNKALKLALGLSLTPIILLLLATSM